MSQPSDPKAPSGQAQLPFGARADRARQPGTLRAALANLRPGRTVCVFDLDSTLLRNQQRQARIFREYGAAHGDPRFLLCTPQHVVSWDLRDAALLLGLTAAEAEAHHAALREFWRARFFTSDYCKDDEPVPGARQFLAEVVRAGGRILYVTGRHAAMGPGTEESFRRAGFPMPAGKEATWPAPVELWLKPDEAQDDDAWKEQCHKALAQQGDLAMAFDNEPVHINAYKARFPKAAAVHLDTDHSRRPVAVRDDIPSVADFRLELP